MMVITWHCLPFSCWKSKGQRAVDHVYFTIVWLAVDVGNLYLYLWDICAPFSEIYIILLNLKRLNFFFIIYWNILFTQRYHSFLILSIANFSQEFSFVGVLHSLCFILSKWNFSFFIVSYLSFLYWLNFYILRVFFNEVIKLFCITKMF